MDLYEAACDAEHASTAADGAAAVLTIGATGSASAAAGQAHAAGFPAAGHTVLPPASNFQPARDWFTQPCLLGIDEAGRGPVLGAMVYACVAAPLAYRETLATKSYADSKTLTEAERSKLFAALAADSNCVYAADALSAAFISGHMLGRTRVSLNAIAEQSTIGLIQSLLNGGVQLKEVYIDTVGDPDRYKAKLEREFPGLSFTVCPKADALYPVVSAASIVAKVLRDTALQVEEQQLPAKHAGNLGNGYPSDPVTQAWLAANCDPVFGFIPLVRFSWETCSRWAADGAADGSMSVHPCDSRLLPDPILAVPKQSISCAWSMTF
eukprot:GHRR01023755.1.p1 GENE.GHRR01023755.1~~GHRR01023755.1.p1  ORF type:complete len:324 (+),score=117.04 GHRR01023755.1:855-1826(+)